MKDNRVTRQPLMDCVKRTHEVAERVKAGDFAGALALRGRRFERNLQTLRTIIRALPHPVTPGQKRLNIAFIHSGGPAPGMNTAVRATVRLALDQGHRILAVRNGFRGFVDGDFREMEWMSVNGWASRGGAELGTNRRVPADRELYSIARHIESQKIDAILMVGGWSGYQAIHKLRAERERFPAFDIPMICMPASINNNLPGSEISIGSDSALNSIVEAVDKIKQSAVASQRCFVVEVMGRRCGYLALLSGLATGAERVYMHEEGVTLADLQRGPARPCRRASARASGSASSSAPRRPTRSTRPRSCTRCSSRRGATSSTFARPSWVTSSRAGTRVPSTASSPPALRPNASRT